MAVRLTEPGAKYDPENEAQFRRQVAEFLGSNEFPEIRIAGGVLYGDSGALKFRSKNGTVTTLANL
jgi:hypothetical protein